MTIAAYTNGASVGDSDRLRSSSASRSLVTPKFGFGNTAKLATTVTIGGIGFFAGEAIAATGTVFSKKLVNSLSQLGERVSDAKSSASEAFGQNVASHVVSGVGILGAMGTRFALGRMKGQKNRAKYPTQCFNALFHAFPILGVIATGYAGKAGADAESKLGSRLSTIKEGSTIAREAFLAKILNPIGHAIRDGIGFLPLSFAAQYMGQKFPLRAPVSSHRLQPWPGR